MPRTKGLYRIMASEDNVNFVDLATDREIQNAADAKKWLQANTVVYKFVRVVDIRYENNTETVAEDANQLKFEFASN